MCHVLDRFAQRITKARSVFVVFLYQAQPFGIVYPQLAQQFSSRNGVLVDGLFVFLGQWPNVLCQLVLQRCHANVHGQCGPAQRCQFWPPHVGRCGHQVAQHGCYEGVCCAVTVTCRL